MANFRSLEEISQAMLDYLRIVQPDLDTKPGQVARDLFVDTPATEIAKLYIELRNIQNLQAISSASGRDLTLLARNFGVTRGTGSPSGGIVVFTTNTLDSDIFIPFGTTVTARNGITFRTTTDVTMSASRANVYRANAIRLRSNLDLAGINDEFAIEVAVEANTFGASGNIGRFGITTHSVAGISSVTNTSSFTGGSNTESDDAFRARILGVFAGSNTGTSLGYVNALLSDSSIVDVITVEPGSPLMTRDGTDVSINDSGEKVVISSGTGGKVDIYIQGARLEQNTESWIYRDQSGRNDPTDPSNDFVLGQRDVSSALDYQQKRVLLLDAGTLPSQPVDAIINLSGSLSGPNFVQKYTDSTGQVRGTYELLKDEGDLGGSAFGLDRIHFISNTIELDGERSSKGIFNGEDSLDFTDVNSVDSVTQSIIVTNETPELSTTDRSYITLKHTPISVVNSVANFTTGQRYTIVDSNPDGVIGELNTTGRIQISGGTLPTSNDILQVNYIWQKEFDHLVDYDNLESSSIIRTTQDSIDWGYSNRVINEEQTVLYSVVDGYHVLVTHPISRVTNVNSRLSENLVVTAGKLTVASEVIQSIYSILGPDGKEVYYTNLSNGSFSGYEITLPTDAAINNGDTATVYYNNVDLYSPDGYDAGTYGGSQINLEDGLANAGDTVFVDYVASVNNLLPTTSLTSLPAVGSQNQFVVSSSLVGNQPISNLYDVNEEITRNLRYAPSLLRMNFQGIPSTGRITIKGSSFRTMSAVTVVRVDGLTIDLSEAIRSALGATTIPGTGFVAMIDKIQRVTLSDGEVSSIDFEFDTNNYKIKNAEYSNGAAIEDGSLTYYQVKLDSTTENLDEVPTTGQHLYVSFIYVDTNTTERVRVTNSGIQYSKYRYGYISNISVDSGFLNLSGGIDGTLSIDNFNQPVSGTSYLASYSYTAPKEGERITVSYNYNRLISDSIFTIESVRPVTADVLVKQAQEVEVDVSVEIVALPTYSGGDANLIQSTQEAITNFLNSNSLGTVVDASDLINAIYDVIGVDRVEIITFNNSGSTGVRQSIEAESNQYITSGTISVTIEER